MLVVVVVVIVGRGAELVDSSSSTIIHCAIEHKISAVGFEKLLKVVKQFKPDALSRYIIRLPGNYNFCVPKL